MKGVLETVNEMGKRGKSNLGNALLRSRKAPGLSGESKRHTTDIHDENGKLILQSITEQDALSEFISTAELANRDFTAEKMNTTTIVTSAHIPGVLTEEEEHEIKIFQDANKEFLNIPRRPHWDSDTTREQLELAEKESFLQWRRQLALLDEKDERIVLTPYEKNIDVWRQLWRVIERSDVICQIVDARNPLLFKCDDVEKYAKEVDKNMVHLIIVNKADYLTQPQRKYWANYFASRHVKVIFWSALIASMAEEEMQEDSCLADEMRDEKDVNMDAQPVASSCEAVEQRDDNNENNGEGFVDKRDIIDSGMEGEKGSDGHAGNELIEAEVNEIRHEEESQEQGSCQYDEDRTLCKFKISEEHCEWKNVHSIFSRDELIDYFEKLKLRRCPEKEKIMVGMVGFPNVGKSSTINALLGNKKTSVSSTPGKTKHFQTINISNTVCLCDCPGLVFPTFVSTKAEMILNGILPVDQMRDYRPATTLLCRLIPREILQAVYGINISHPQEWEDANRPPTADEFLSAYSTMRGFMTSHGMPDCSRGSRYVIKDFLNGKLLYCEPPPGITPSSFRPVQLLQEKVQSRQRKENYTEKPKSSLSKVDQEFFSKGDSGVYYNAPSGVRQVEGDRLAQAGKPWKKHFNRNKKEKTRRIKRD